MQIPLWLLICDVLLWLGIFLLHAVQINGAVLSPFELKRRSDANDPSAVKDSEREKLLPRMQTLRRIFEAIFLVIATALTIMLFGWLVGTVIASLLSLLVGTVAQLSLFLKIAKKLYEPREVTLLTLVKAWQWLDWFKGFTEESKDVTASSKSELQYIVERSSAVLNRDELLRLQAGLVLDARTVEDAMTPVSMVETADVHDSLGPLVLDSLHKTGHSRFPVISGDIHHIVGILYLHDIINLRSAKATVREAMDSQVHYIHAEQSLEHALNGFLRTHRHLFVVVNDYRETVGVLALEDVIETILGKKIVDEFDKYEDLRAVAESNPRKNNLPKGKTDV